MRPSCYGQPGNSWAPQSNAALRRVGIPMYLDDGSHVGLGEQPFWYGGLLWVFNMGILKVRGGGDISIYYHPTEFVTAPPKRSLWAADMLLALPGVDAQFVEGPTARSSSRMQAGRIPRAASLRVDGRSKAFCAALRNCLR